MLSRFERRRYWATTRLAYRIILPSIIIVFGLIGFPILYSISIAISEYKYGVATGKIVFFQNFIDIFTKQTVAPIFFNSLLVTFKFVLLAVSAIIIFSLMLAMLINQRFRGNHLVKIALLLPYAIPGAVSAAIWNWIYDPSFGVMNGILSSLGILDEYISVAADPDLALWAILVAYVWKFVPYCTFLLSAGITTIPSSVYEAARIDRCGTIRTFFKITLPLLMPVLQMTLVIQTIFAMVAHFGLIFVITQGGPGDATQTLAWLVYNESFAYSRYGRGAAMAFILSLIMFAFIYLYLVVLNPERRQRRQIAMASLRE